MDFSKLSSSERMTVIAAVVVGVLAIYALAYGWGGLMALALIGAVAVLAIIFLPQMSPNSSLPGSRGTLLLVAGGGAALFWALTTLVELSYIFNNFDEIDTWIFLIGFAAALWLGWQSWRAFQAEGGTFRLGSSSDASAPSATQPPAEAAAASPPPPASSEPMSNQPMSSEPMSSEPMTEARDDEGRPTV
jgi:hypothetical protein